MKAIWKDHIIASSDDTLVVEGNHYFPADSIDMKYFTDSDNSSYCPWKGSANYYSIEVDGVTNKDAAWYYKDPKEKAQNIKGHIAFWKGVEVIED
jgi:uncharacterized protein (DUF427 family)